MSQTDDDQAVARMADIITLAILDAEKGNQAALTFLATALPDWQKRRVGALQTTPTVTEKTTMDAIDYDAPVAELGGLTRREFGKQYNVDPAFVLMPPSPELDARLRIADVLGVDPKYVTADALAEIEGV